MAAFSGAPGTHISGLEYKTAGQTVTADSVVIPIAAIPELTAAEADPTTGDIRKFLFAFLEAFHQIVLASAWADADDVPANYRSSKSTTPNDADDTATRHYTQVLVLDGAFEVADE